MVTDFRTYTIYKIYNYIIEYQRRPIISQTPPVGNHLILLQSSAKTTNTGKLSMNKSQFVDRLSTNKAYHNIISYLIILRYSDTNLTFLFERLHLKYFVHNLDKKPTLIIFPYNIFLIYIPVYSCNMDNGNFGFRI